MGRPLFAYGNLIHNQCERRPHFEFGEFALAWGDEGAQTGWCLYKLGCKGPETMANCPTVRYGDGDQLERPGRARLHRLHDAGLLGRDGPGLPAPAGPRPVPSRTSRRTWSVRRWSAGSRAVAGVHAVGHGRPLQAPGARSQRREALGRDRRAASRSRRGRRRARGPAPRSVAAAADDPRAEVERRAATHAEAVAPTIRTQRPTRAPPAPPGGALTMARITIDPVTRVGGQLRIEAEVAGGARRRGLGVGDDVPGHRDGPARAATRATPGCSPSASAAPAPASTRSRRSARSSRRSAIDDPDQRPPDPQHPRGHGRSSATTS